MQSDPSQAPLRRLLPATAGKRRETTPPPSKRRISAACKSCRVRKTKCNGDRPKCSACAARATNCEYAETEVRVVRRKYEDLRTKMSKHEELLELFRVLPSQDATDLLQRLRSGEDANSLLRHVQTGDLLVQLSVAPEMRRRYEFPYLTDMPAPLLEPGNPYSKSILLDFTREVQPANQTVIERSESLWDSDAYSKPYHAAEIADPMLSDLDFSQWTSVTSNNKLLTKILSRYLQFAYNIFLPFPKDLFLQDLASGRTDHCSSLLVNAVLAAGCQAYTEHSGRSKFWSPETLLYKFLAESRMLWDLESIGETRLTTIQAAYTLATIMNLNGVDKLGFNYLLQGISMCDELKLFKSSSSVYTPKEKRARLWTAWGIWVYQVQVGYYFLQRPHLAAPPEDPLPDPAHNPNWFGESWMKYPQSGVLIPIHLGHCMKARYDLMAIICEIATESFTEPRYLSLNRARRYHTRLETWYNDLPAPLTARRLFTPLHFLIHLDYCHTVISLFEPHVGEVQNGDVTDSIDSPTTIVNSVKLRFETLVRLYYLRHKFEAFDCHLGMYTMVLANRAVQALKTLKNGGNVAPPIAHKELLSTLILCAKGIRDQGNSYYLGHLLYLALIGCLEPEDIPIVRTHTYPAMEIENSTIPEHALLHWPLPIVKMNEDPNKAALNSLVKEYESMTLRNGNTV